MIQQLTALGILFDVLVCTIFAIRLTKKYREDSTNLFLKNFVSFFWLFDLFLLFTVLYIPDLVIPSNSMLLNFTFGTSFLVLYAVSAFAMKIVALVNFPKIDSRWLFYPMFFFGFLIAAYVYSSNNPMIYYENGRYLLRHGILMSFLTAAPLSVAFIASSYTFFRQAVKNKEGRTRSTLLSFAFILWLLGGASHSMVTDAIAVVGADLVVAAGFLAAFIALLKSPEKD